MDQRNQGKKAVSQDQESPHRKIFSYYANLIGYFRIILLFIGFYFNRINSAMFLLCYTVSFSLDVLDGHVARSWRQTSRFGAALDIFTDKVSTPGLLLTLSHLYPDYTFLFNCVLMLDVSSHYFHFYSTLLYGTRSHKDIDPAKKRHIYWLLVWFYTHRIFFGFCCLGYESFLVLMYIYSFYPYDIVYTGLCLTVLSFIFKNLVHVAQLFASVDDIVKWDHDHKTHLEYEIPEPWFFGPRFSDRDEKVDTPIRKGEGKK